MERSDPKAAAESKKAVEINRGGAFDGGAFDGDAHLPGLFGGVDGDLVLGAVAFLDAEIVIEQVDIEIGQDQLLLDEIPDDPGHLVAVHLDDGVVHLRAVASTSAWL